MSRKDKDFQLRKTPRDLSQMHYNPKQFRQRPQESKPAGWFSQLVIWLLLLAALFAVFKYFGK